MADTRTEIVVRMAALLRDNPEQIPFAIGYLAGSISPSDLMLLERTLELSVTNRKGD